MLKNKYSVRKYIVSTTIVTGFVFSPMFASGAFANAGPEAEVNQSNISNVLVTEQKDATPIKSGNITKGDRGETVKAMQTSLQNHGQNLNADGIFGEETDQAVRNIQSSNDLVVDGIVGSATKQALELPTATTTATNKTTEKIDVPEENVKVASAPKAQARTLAVEAPTSTDSDIVSIASKLVGSPYTPGGTTPAGFDSSGFINYVFNQAGISLDRTHASMWANNGTHVDSPSVGDVVFFENTYQDGVSHSGIYLGNNQMIHAGTEATGVEITSTDIDYWSSRYIGAKSFK